MEKMLSIIIGIVGLLQLGQVSSDTTIISMNKDQNDCGKVVVLDPSHEVRIKSDGLAPDGYCGVSVFTPTKVEDYTCDALCVTFKMASMSTCEVKVKFVGHKFRKEGDYVREYNCHAQNKDAFCWDVSSMRVEVIEGYNYAYQAQKALYELDLDVHARCTKDAVRSAQAAHYASRSKSEEQEKQTYVEGIAVGISLACVFLIVLFIAWCYTKHQAVAGGPSNNVSRPPPRQSEPRKKSNIISTFRKKLHIKPKHAQSEEEPEATYRKTETSAEGQRSRDSDVTIPLTKESDHETYELANETLSEEKNEENKVDTEKDTDKNSGEDSPKDGGAEGSKLELPEVVISPGTPEPPKEDSD